MSTFKDEYIDEISKVNPSTNVTDESFNLSISELENNIKFVANLLSTSSLNSSNFLSSLYGNLLDYDRNGDKLFFNGGSFDCFEKKNSWIAIDDGDVTNSTDIQTETGATNLLVYRGGVSTVGVDDVEVGRWIERDFYIPPMLRGSELIFALKGTGVNTLADQIVSHTYSIPYCNTDPFPYCSSASPISGAGEAPCTPGTTGSSGTCTPELSSGCYARYEDIGIEVIGATTTVQKISKIGPWPNHKYYVENGWGPEFRSSYVTFKVGKNTDLIKIKIRRTQANGAIALSQAFLGCLPMPIEEYNIENFDINELFDFSRGVSKFNSTSVNGKHISQSSTNTKLTNLLTKEQQLKLSYFNKQIDNFYIDPMASPTYTALDFGTMTTVPNTLNHRIYEFSPSYVQSLYFDMHVDGGNPGLGYIGLSYFVNSNGNSGTISCSISGGDQNDICSYVRFVVEVTTVNTGEIGAYGGHAPNSYCYDIPVYRYMLAGKMNYVEIYGDFFQHLTEDRGSIVSIRVNRDGVYEQATVDYNDFEGNFLLASLKVGSVIPPDDIPDTITYTDLFVGNNPEC